MSEDGASKPITRHNHLARAHRLLYRNGNHCYGLFFSFGGRRSVLRDILEGPPRPDRVSR